MPKTYATSGPRISLRFFGGWQYGDTLVEEHDWLELAYADGVPMGSRLTDQQDNHAPVFVLWASKDSIGANLDRLQVVKA